MVRVGRAGTQLAVSPRGLVPSSPGPPILCRAEASVACAGPGKGGRACIILCAYVCLKKRRGPVTIPLVVQVLRATAFSLPPAAACSVLQEAAVP